MISAPSLDLGLQLAQEAKKEAALAYAPGFITTYFTDAKGEPIELEEFHLEIIDAITDWDTQRVLLLAPADHGKTTLTRFCLDYLAVRDRNLRMMLVGNNATDAEQALGAIERDLSDPGSPVVKDFGDLKGDLWQTGQFNISGRTIVDKEPTLAAYGTGSNVFGHRSDLVLADDLLNLENAGPFVTPRTRQVVHDWFFEGLLKVAGKEGKVVVIGTVMDKRDLYHELMDPRHGFKVVKMKALIDDATHTVLWPKRNPYEYLAAQRESDYISFMKRYQNEAMDPSTATFDSERLPMCLDRTRRWGEISEDMKKAGFTRVLVTMDPFGGARGKKSSWTGICVGAYDPRQEPPRMLYVLKIYRTQARMEETEAAIAAGDLGALDMMMKEHQDYDATASVIESNAQNKLILESPRLRKFVDGRRTIIAHQTGDNKHDPDIGVNAVAVSMKATLISFPYGDEVARKNVDSFFSEEIVSHPMGRFTDRLMALWFFHLKANEETSHPFKVVYRRFLPTWLRGTGLAPAAMKRAV